MVNGINTAASSYVQAQSGSTNRSQRLQNLFQQIDSSGKGYITKDDLQAYMKSQGVTDQSKIDAMWKSLDPNGTGKVDQTQFVDTMKKAGHHHHAEGAQAQDQTGQSQNGSLTLNITLSGISPSAVKSIFDSLSNNGSTTGSAIGSSQSGSSGATSQSGSDALTAITDFLKKQLASTVNSYTSQGAVSQSLKGLFTNTLT